MQLLSSLSLAPWLLRPVLPSCTDFRSRSETNAFLGRGVRRAVTSVQARLMPEDK